MRYFIGIWAICVATYETTFAALGRAIQQSPGGQETESESGGIALDGLGWFFAGFFGNIIPIFIYAISIIAFIYIIFKSIRLAFELFYSKNLRYLQITVPRADSKLDKEKETKKDFKEKIGQMSMFYKAVHKLSEAGLRDTLLNFLFGHSKISLELIYENGEVTFYIVTYKNYVNLISQHITSIYNDAEILQVEKDKYVKLKKPGYRIRAASLGKEHDDYFPIKSFKYLEDDPINNFTNVFGGLDKDDMAVYQVVIKPTSSKWNQKALKAARMVAKGKYKKKKKLTFLRVIFKPFSWLWNPLVAMIEWPEDMVWGNSAPGASEGDAYKIFNQAETEAQKVMGESAAQPSFQTSIRVIVSSKTHRQAENAVHAIVAAASIFTDEYNNALDNPQIYEDSLPWIFTPIRHFAFRHKLVGFFQNKSVFSADEASTLYHMPDINYNKSPIINWLEYKKLPVPHNVKFPTQPTMLEEKNEKTGQVEKVHRHLGGFPVYKDGVLLGWNEYRNKKTPIYFSRKDRGRHQYIIWKSGWGKSVYIGYLARQDVWNGDGLCVIDPHGDLVEDVLEFVPKERAKDVIIFDPADTDRPMGLNMLDIISTDPDIRKREMDRAAMDATEIFIKIFWDEIFGPRIQHYFRNGCLTLMEDQDDGGTLIDVPMPIQVTEKNKKWYHIFQPNFDHLLRILRFVILLVSQNQHLISVKSWITERSFWLISQKVKSELSTRSFSGSYLYQKLTWLRWAVLICQKKNVKTFTCMWMSFKTLLQKLLEKYSLRHVNTVSRLLWPTSLSRKSEDNLNEINPLLKMLYSGMLVRYNHLKLGLMMRNIWKRNTHLSSLNKISLV